MANEKDANVEFSSYEIDAVGEILNISMGSAATAVSELLNAKVWITTPQVSVVKAADLNYDRLEPAICVKIVYVSGISGQNMMVLKQDDVQLILNQLMGNPLVVSPDFEFDEMNISAVSEVMNQMMGASATALSDLLGISVDISTPTPYLIEQTNFCQLAELDPDETIVAVTFNLSVDGVMNSEFMSVMSVDLAKSLSDKMIEKFHGDEAEAQPDKQPAPAPAAQPAPVSASKPAAPAPQPAPAPTPQPQSNNAAQVAAAGAAETPAVEDAGELQRKWAEVVERVKARQASYAGLLLNARATADDGSKLTVSFPAGSTFAIKMLGRADTQSVVLPTVCAVFGRRTVDYVLDGGGTPAPQHEEHSPSARAAASADPQPVSSAAPVSSSASAPQQQAAPVTASTSSAPKPAAPKPAAPTPAPKPVSPAPKSAVAAPKEEDAPAAPWESNPGAGSPFGHQGAAPSIPQTEDEAKDLIRSVFGQATIFKPVE